MNPEPEVPTAHEDEESPVPATGVDAPGAPDQPVVDPAMPHITGKRADEHDAQISLDENPPPRPQ